MFKKGFSTILVVVIALVVITGGVLVWQYWTGELVEEDQEQPAVDGGIEAIADWQTYRNDGYGYELEYPKQSFLSEFCEGSPVRGDYCETKKAGFSFTRKEHQKVIPGPPYDDDINIKVSAKSAYPGKSLMDIAEDRDSREIIIEEKRTDTGLSYLFYKNPTYPKYFQYAFFENDKNFYMISFVVDNPDIDMKIDVFNQMLSTFKFLD